MASPEDRVVTPDTRPTDEIDTFVEAAQGRHAAQRGNAARDGQIISDSLMWMMWHVWFSRRMKVHKSPERI